LLILYFLNLIGSRDVARHKLLVFKHNIVPLIAAEATSFVLIQNEAKNQDKENASPRRPYSSKGVLRPGPLPLSFRPLPAFFGYTNLFWN
jgi:hypothetical protein